MKKMKGIISDLLPSRLGHATIIMVARNDISIGSNPFRKYTLAESLCL